MDIQGEGLNPAKTHLFKLAMEDDSGRAWAENVIEKIVLVAARFNDLSQDYAVRKTPRTDIANAIRKNCARMA